MAATTRTRVFIASQFCNGVVDYLKKLSSHNEYIVHKFENAVDGQVSFDLKITPCDMAALGDAEILITDNNLIDQFAYKLPKLKWIQGTFAGIDRPVKTLNSETFKTKGDVSFIVTRFSGECYGQMFVDYIVSFVIAIQRGFVDHILHRNTRDWSLLKKMSPPNIRNLNEVNFSLLGVGAIGSFVSKQLTLRGCSVSGFGLSTKSDAFLKSNCLSRYSTDLKDIISESDCIVNILPHTTNTIGLLDGQFVHCKNAPLFINVGRGSVVSEKYLIESLDCGLISMAVLDVFQEEPLPPNSALWTHPKVIITPHIASETRNLDLARVFLTNLHHFLKGEQLQYTVDWRSGY